MCYVRGTSPFRSISGGWTPFDRLVYNIQGKSKRTELLEFTFKTWRSKLLPLIWLKSMKTAYYGGQLNKITLEMKQSSVSNRLHGHVHPNIYLFIYFPDKTMAVRRMNHWSFLAVLKENLNGWLLLCTLMEMLQQRLVFDVTKKIAWLLLFADIYVNTFSCDNLCFLFLLVLFVLFLLFPAI